MQHGRTLGGKFHIQQTTKTSRENVVVYNKDKEKIWEMML
jgi:hypothetical protein